MQHAVAPLPVVAVLMACTPFSEQATKAGMSLAQAEVHCEQQTNAFARRPLPIRGEDGVLVGLRAEYPDDFQLQQFYRGCVGAHSGISIKKRVAWRL